MLMQILFKFQNSLNSAARNPVSLGISISFLIGWTLASLLSHGTFDPNFGIGNLIINGLSILLLFAANSQRSDNHDTTHEKLDEIHQHLKDLTDK